MLASYLARLGLTAAAALRAPRAHVLDEVPLPLTIWPQDIDVFGHLNNGRYLTLMDNGRWMHTLRTGMFRTMMEKKWKPLLGAAAIEFKREVTSFQRCTLTTRFIGWDPEKWGYIEHRVQRGDTVHARAIVRMVVKHGRRTVPIPEVLEAMGVSAASPLSPAQLQEEVGRLVVSVP